MIKNMVPEISQINNLVSSNLRLIQRRDELARMPDPYTPFGSQSVSHLTSENQEDARMSEEETSLEQSSQMERDSNQIGSVN